MARQRSAAIDAHRARSGRARHQHAADGRDRGLPPAPRDRAICRSSSCPRAMTRSIGSSASSSALTIMSPSPSPRARWSRGSWRSCAASAGASAAGRSARRQRHATVACCSIQMGGRHAGTGSQCRSPSPNSASCAPSPRCPPRCSAATRSSIGCAGPASRSPTARSTAMSATSARNSTPRAAPISIETRPGIGYRIGSCGGVIDALKAPIRRHWPRLQLRTILLITLLFVAALPGVGALFLRVYENTLVRQTEAELVAQGAALAAVAAADWPPLTGPPRRPLDAAGSPANGMLSTIDLRTTPVLPERPAPVPIAGAPTTRARCGPPRGSRLSCGRRLEPRSPRSCCWTIMAGSLIGRDPGDAYRRPARSRRRACRAAPIRYCAATAAYRAHYALEWLSRASRSAHPSCAPGDRRWPRGRRAAPLAVAARAVSRHLRGSRQDRCSASARSSPRWSC